MSQQMLSVILDGDDKLTLDEISRILGLGEKWFSNLVEIGVLHAQGNAPESWVFDGAQLTRAQRAMRIQQDFNASFTALGLIMELMDELDQLRQLQRFSRLRQVLDID